MATLAAVRAALVTRLSASLAGTRIHAMLPEMLIPPFVAVLYLRPVEDPHATFAGDAYDEFSLLVGVQANDLPKAQEALDAYMSMSGSLSVPACLDAAGTLGGVVHYVLFKGWAEPGKLDDGAGGIHGVAGSVYVYHS